MRYLISYDLSKPTPAKQRQDLETELKGRKLSGKYLLRTEYVVEWNKSAPELFDHLKKHFKSGDSVLIVKMPARAGKVFRDAVGFGLPSDPNIVDVSL